MRYFVISSTIEKDEKEQSITRWQLIAVSISLKEAIAYAEKWEQDHKAWDNRAFVTMRLA